MSIQASVRAWVVCLAAISCTAHAATIYVSTEGNDGNAGTSWPTAKATLQAGLDAAESGDQVWVAAGTYVECITLKDGVGLYGGFAGWEGDLSDRDWTTNVTTLDGNQAGSVVTVPAGATEATRIDGFTIRNGTGTSAGAYTSGGGIYCRSASATIANNTITGCSANYGAGITNAYGTATISGNTIESNVAAGSYGYGGGIYSYSSSPTITDNVITENDAILGGGIYTEDASPSPTITSNTISHNHAAHAGGGIYCRISSPVITENIITDNDTGDPWTAGSGGGVCCDISVTAEIARNTISKNRSGDGAGIACNTSSSVPSVTSNTISGNTASSRGGGIYCHSSTTHISANTISNNAVTGAPGYGGGICCNGSVFDNNMITGNSAYQGGGAHCPNSTCVNNTITGNSSFDGGGMYCGGTTIVNTIVASNSSGISIIPASTMSLRCNCVYGNSTYNYSGADDPSGSDGNISADPRFACGPAANVHIQPDSPCIDAGDDTAVDTIGTDVDGQARKQGLHVDIGADESDGTGWPSPAVTVIHVSTQGNDEHDGSSWALAKRSVQAGIDAAAASGRKCGWRQEPTSKT